MLRLCARADFENLARIRLAFPDHVEAYLAWRDSHVTNIGDEW